MDCYGLSWSVTDHLIKPAVCNVISLPDLPPVLSPLPDLVVYWPTCQVMPPTRLTMFFLTCDGAFNWSHDACLLGRAPLMLHVAGMRFPCDLCHEEATDHEARWAQRMVCGFCSTEQPVDGECRACGKKLARGAGNASGGTGG